jgi:hypothetical protein
MITYIEKGIGLHTAIREAGYLLSQIDGIWQSSNDTAVQLIIDNYDPLILAKTNAIRRVRMEAGRRAYILYPFIDPTLSQALGLYNLVQDLYLSIIPSGREPLSGKLLDFKNIHDIAVSATNTINTMTDWNLVDLYNETIDPGW